MLCENYTSDLLPYTLFSSGAYNSDIPAGYDERINSSIVLGLFFEADNTTVGRVVFMAWTDRRAWPGYQVNRWVFSADDGSFVSEDIGGVGGGYVGSAEISQGANDELYGEALVGGGIYRLVPGTYAATDDAPIVASHFGAAVIDCFTIDRMRDLFITHTNADGLYQLGVYKLSDGSVVRRIELPDTPAEICHGGGTHVYVLLTNKLLIGLDYSTGQIFQCTRLPQISNPEEAKIAYDRRYQRLLVVEYTADNVDGSSTIRVHGYRNRPVGVHVCKPIPLKRLRTGQKTPVLHKLIGDAGEGITGMLNSSATNVNAQVTRLLVPLDGDGEGVGEVIGLAEGNDTITVTGDVQCLL